jgi:hypothetical protein
VEFCDRPLNPPILGDFEIGGMPCSQEMVEDGVFFWRYRSGSTTRSAGNLGLIALNMIWSVSHEDEFETECFVFDGIGCVGFDELCGEQGGSVQ